MVSELSVESQAGSWGRLSILFDFVGRGGKCNNPSLCMDEIVSHSVGNRVLILPKVTRAFLGELLLFVHQKAKCSGEDLEM